MATQWEYKTLRLQIGFKGFKYEELEAELNTLGRQGWEAVSTLAPGAAVEVAVLLKRPRG
ncbi:DUF4177 domain-containing protein [Kribbella sandramycini]|uniref:DUF4177 domain-containing protein n=1 Tax=Kribbella sandramycini TaxID=60450 RepID=A0A7Y4NYX4_9ACTN|nr:DUF4177 domain-containing protein [Kribbella sandramycini]MBB6565148.1 hypothetical protein [Kribbella sandramycini]NOL41417.1 DUF4177 domain-containing protein [Kribbella sandramycini]